MEERLIRNRDRAAQRKERIETCDALEMRRSRATAALRQDRTALAELMAELGAGTRDELDRLIDRASQRREAAVAAAQCESDLLEQGSGWTVEQHVQAAADTSPDQVAAG